MDNPLVPLLRKTPLVPYEINIWCCNSVWLHKQPLFMWQMALSMKIFGANEFTMRLPSALMGAISILLVYRISLLLTRNKTTSLIAGLLICFSQYQLEMISGQIGMDHNDVAFSFYILASFWAFSEKQNNEKMIWNILIGIFAGCAILNKWLVGLLVFLPFGLLALFQLFKERKTSEIKNILISLLCCLATFLPWQLYILHKFPEIAIYEYQYNSKHLFEAVEGHAGGFLFYYNYFNDYFGAYIWYLIFWGPLIAFIKKDNFNSLLNWTLLVSFLTVFVFFSFIVQSKLPNYFFIAVPFGIIYIAIALQQILQFINVKWITYGLILLVLAVTLNPQKSVERRKNNIKRENLLYNTQIFKNLKQLIPPYVKTVVNVNSFEDIDVMFYHNDITAYHWIGGENLDSLKKQKVWIGAFKDQGTNILPDEFKDYPYLYKIDVMLK